MTRRPKPVRSIGAVQTPTDPVTTQAALGVPESTGAEPFHDEPVRTRVSFVDEPITVHSATPGPVTMTVGWLAHAEARVIEPAEPPSPAPARTQAHTKTSRTRGRAGNRRTRRRVRAGRARDRATARVDLLRTGTLRQLGQLFANLGGIVRAVFTGLDTGGAGLLDTLVRVTGQARAFLESFEGQQALASLGQLLSTVSTVVNTVLLTDIA